MNRNPNCLWACVLGALLAATSAVTSAAAQRHDGARRNDGDGRVTVGTARRSASPDEVTGILERLAAGEDRPGGELRDWVLCAGEGDRADRAKALAELRLPDRAIDDLLDIATGSAGDPAVSGPALAAMARLDERAGRGALELCARIGAGELESFTGPELPQDVERIPGYPTGSESTRWLRELQDPRPRYRARAVRVLSRSGLPGRALPAVIARLGDRDPQVRRLAVHALAHLRPMPADLVAGAFLRVLADPRTRDPDRALVARAIKYCYLFAEDDTVDRWPALRALRTMLETSHAGLQAAAISSLVYIDPEVQRLAPVVLRLFAQRSDPVLQRAAMEAMGVLCRHGLARQQVAPHLQGILDSQRGLEDPRTRVAAIRALASLRQASPDPRITVRLLEGIDDESAEVRAQALSGLGYRVRSSAPQVLAAPR